MSCYRSEGDSKPNIGFCVFVTMMIVVYCVPLIVTGCKLGSFGFRLIPSRFPTARLVYAAFEPSEISPRHKFMGQCFSRIQLKLLE